MKGINLHLGKIKNIKFDSLNLKFFASSLIENGPVVLEKKLKM
jgi:hypothetical protein